MTISRRTLLRGTLHGATIGVALPFLDMFLDNNGEALAATGQRIPVRFGTWIWGCGFIADRWIPKTTGKDFVLPADLEPLAKHKDKLALFSGFDVRLDGVPNKPHVTGCLGLRTGMPVAGDNVALPTFDTIIADQISAGTRFKSLELSTTGITRSYSFRGPGNVNPSEISPVALYQRIFGEGFQDPNATKPFEPDPKAMVRKSVLSAVTEDRLKVMGIVGADDKRRLDEYFTGIRQLEEKLELQLQPPAPVKGFVMPKAPQETANDAVIDNVMVTHKLMAGLLARALQANQTRVFNVLFSDTTSNLRRKGSTTTHHTLTHGEPVNPQLGYQEQVGWFAAKSMVAWAEFLDAIAEIPEGAGTLLDNTLILAHSDCSNANAHAVEGIPMMVAGNAGGQVRTGFHMAGAGDANTRMGLTLMQAMGVQTERWGTKSMETNRTISELLG